MHTAARTIASLNDAFRRTLGIGGPPGQVFLTSGVAALPESTLSTILHAVSTFNAFTHDNDPHQEHDFGRIVTADRTAVFFKFDYFADQSLTTGAENGSACYRVLTIMLTEEY